MKHVTSKPSLISSSIMTNLNDQGTISTLSSESDRVHNLKRSLSRSKKQIESLKNINEKYENKLDLLTKKINEINHNFMQEKKVANILLERSRAEHEEIIDATRALIKESKSVEKSKSIEENQLKEKLKTSEIIRDV